MALPTNICKLRGKGGGGNIGTWVGIHNTSCDLRVGTEKNTFKSPEAVFLVVCNPSMNELWITLTGLCIDLYGSRSLTVRS
jgi:hypothetical protein